MFHAFITPHVLVARLLATVASTLFFCVAFVSQGFAQSWQPAAQIDGARLSINIVTLPDGTTLVPLRWVLPNQKDTLLFFSIESLLSIREPWPRQIPKLQHVRGVYHGNGNGYPESMISLFVGSSQFVTDLFSDKMRIEPIPRDTGLWPLPMEMVEYQGDISGDAYEEQMVAARYDQFARIAYGDSSVPYLNRSIVPANYQRSNERRAKILAVGKLSGRTCMLQLAFKADTYDSGYYQLLELNQADVRARRDTIRTTLLNEVSNPDKWLFSEVVLKADTVWHFFPGGYSTEKASLKVTLSRSSISFTKSEIRVSDHSFWYGQGKETSQWNYPVTMSAHRLIAADMGATPGAIQRVLRLFTCSNIDDAELSRFADAQLPITHDSSRGYVAAAVLIPDYDGDGIEDVIVEHGWADPQTRENRHVVSVFLTTQIQPVSVISNQSVVTPPDTSKAMPSYRSGQGWVAPNATHCYHEESAPTYNSIGVRIGFLRVHISGPDVIIQDDGSVGQGPAWCVVGDCVVRIN